MDTLGVTYELGHPAGISGDVSRQLHRPGEVAQRVRVGVGLAVGLLAGCDHAGITVTDHGRVTSRAGSDDLAARAGVIQQEVGQGPQVELAQSGNRTVFVANLRVDPRWPRWATRMRQELGVHAVLSLLLHTHDESVGVLNLYADQVDAFSTEDFATAQSLATHLAVAVADGQEIARQGQRMIDNTVLGQAEGILMQRYSIGAQEAIAMLARVSHDAHRTPLQIAQDFVHTRTLPVTATADATGDTCD